MLVSIVIPIYNEVGTILDVLARVQEAPLPEGLEKEIILVDDGSTDGTRDLLGRIFAPGVKVVLHSQNKGKSAAVRTGIAQAEGDFFLIQDADLEYDPRDYRGLLVPLVEDRADVVYGSRFLNNALYKRGSFGGLHRFGNGFLTWFSNRLSGLNLSDMETCYKAFRMEVLRSIPLSAERFGFEPEVTITLARQRRWRVLEVPISYQGRSYAEGKKIGVKDAFHALGIMVWAATLKSPYKPGE